MADGNAVLLKKALSYLSRREYHRIELKSKLIRTKSRNEHDVEALLDRLEAEGLLSDMRFIESFIASRQKRFYGPIRIKMELQQKKLDPDDVERILAESDIDWQRNARICLQKKFPKKATDNQELAKRQRFLWQRGYPTEMIRDALKADSDE